MRVSKVLGIREMVMQRENLTNMLTEMTPQQEIQTDKREDSFVATPPLEAKKILLALAVTQGVGFNKGRRHMGMKLDFVDVRRAYFHAKARRDIYVALPAEDATDGMCGTLKKAIYGTRDAAQNWEYEYVEQFENMGFKRGMATPCAFSIDSRD